MAFENVNVSSLKNSINSCIDSINYSSSKEIIEKISSNNIWQASSRDNFKRALTKLVDVRYKNLEKKLKDYLKITDMIEEYQKLSNNQSASQLKLAQINAQINETSDFIKNYNNTTGNADELNTKKSNLNKLVAQKESIKKNINGNDTSLATIKSNIENLL